MIRRAFVRLAQELAAVRPEWQEPFSDGGDVRAKWLSCVNAVMKACAEENELFDKDKFLDTCLGKGEAS